MNEIIHHKLSNQVKEREIISTLLRAGINEKAYIFEHLKFDFLTHPIAIGLYRIASELNSTHQDVNPVSVTDMISSRVAIHEVDIYRLFLQEVLYTDMEDSVENTVKRLAESYQNRIIYNEILVQTNINFSTNNGTPEEILRHIETSLLKMDIGRKTRHVRDVSKDVLDKILYPEKHPQGLATGHEAWDEIFGGICPDTVITIAGFSGSGKTAFVVDMIHRLCNLHKDNVAICLFSLEMSQERIVRRLYTRHARLSEKRMKSHGRFNNAPLTRDEIDRLTNAYAAVSDYPLQIHYETMSAKDIKSKARTFALLNKGKQLVFILDHLGETQKESNDNRIETDRVMQAMKDLCIEYNATSIPLSQLSKAVIDKANGPLFRPNRSHIMESVGVIAKSDIVVLLWRPEAHDIESIPDFEGCETWYTRDRQFWFIHKNRDGQAPIDIISGCSMKYNELFHYTQAVI